MAFSRFNLHTLQAVMMTVAPSLTETNSSIPDNQSNPTNAAPTTALLRDPLLWPFSQDSIWNMPIGSNAKYTDVSIESKGLGVDTDWFIVTKESDPLVPTYLPGAWGEGRATGTTPQPQAQWHPELGEPMHVPYDLIIPDAITSGGVYFTPNNSSAFLHPDGRTLDQFNVTTRTEKGGPLYGYRVTQQDIYGDGAYGGHLGSGLSSIGGSIRKGELLNDEPIHHALKLDIWGKYLYYNPNEGTPGYRWPAILADGAAPSNYQGTNPALEMGALLAIPPSVTAESLGLTTKAGQKIFNALQDYGAYVVDDSGWDYNYIAVEREAELEYEAATGRTINDDTALNEDFNKIIAAVEAVDNNSSISIGGGGTPRQPLAPPLDPTATTDSGITPVDSTGDGTSSSTAGDIAPVDTTGNDSTNSAAGGITPVDTSGNSSSNSTLVDTTGDGTSSGTSLDTTGDGFSNSTAGGTPVVTTGNDSNNGTPVVSAGDGSTPVDTIGGDANPPSQGSHHELFAHHGHHRFHHQGDRLLYGGHDQHSGLANHTPGLHHQDDHLLSGGLRQHTLTGGKRTDIFDLTPSQGSELIRNIHFGEGSIGLSGSLSLGHLPLNQHSNETWIVDNSQHQLLASWEGVEASTLATL